MMKDTAKRNRLLTLLLKSGNFRKNKLNKLSQFLSKWGLSVAENNGTKIRISHNSMGQLAQA